MRLYVHLWLITDQLTEEYNGHKALRKIKPALKIETKIYLQILRMNDWVRISSVFY